MPSLEHQTPPTVKTFHGGAVPSIVAEAPTERCSGAASDRDIVVLSAPLTEPQWDMLRAFVRGTSRESLRLRFGQAVDFADERTLRRFFAIAGSGDEMLWMLEQDGSICAVAHLVRLRSAHAEIALIVRSDRVHRGLGERLLRAALAHASTQGLCVLDALVLYENIPMLRLARKIGFAPHNSLGLTVALEFDLGRVRRSEGISHADQARGHLSRAER
jgi:GNAT superfamily N-acetyltransferase